MRSTPARHARFLLTLALGLSAACDANDSVAPTSPQLSLYAGAVMTPTTVRITKPASTALVVGGTLQLTASSYNSAGAKQTTPIVWKSRAAGVAVVSTAGLVTAKAGGSTYIVASDGGGHPDSVMLTVRSATAAAPSGSGLKIAAVLRRYDGKTGSVLVSNAIPLARGALTPGNAAQVRVFVNGQEQTVYSAPLAAVYPDGSLRSVLVQFNYVVPSAGTTADIYVGQNRGVASLTAAALASRGRPDALLLPSDPNYLVSVGTAGSTVTAAYSTAQGGSFTRYESDFVKFADRLWSARGGVWSENYYDRALIYYAFWERTGNPEYFRRATIMAVSYRKSYLEANNYRTSPHWAQMEGVALHYILTGDESSRTAVGKVAEVLNGGYHKLLSDTKISPSVENRIQARVLQSYLLAWEIDAPRTKGQQWSAWLDDGLTKVLSTQRADGSYGFRVTCQASLNYMTGLLNDVFIKVHTQYRADGRLLTAVKRSVDYLWNTQWLPAASSFRYISKACINVGSPTASPDLNNLMVTGFSWYYRQTMDATYRARADAIFATGVAKAYIQDSKHFNEEYSASFRHLGYR